MTELEKLEELERYIKDHYEEYHGSALVDVVEVTIVTDPASLPPEELFAYMKDSGSKFDG